jgi:phospholipase C
MEQIKHVVVIMLENRGFDSVLGYLYTKNDAPAHNIPALKPSEVAFNGLDFVADKSTLINYLQRGKEPPRSAGPEPGVRATNSPGWDPHEEFEHVTVQIYGPEGTLTDGPQITATRGFLHDYASKWSSVDDSAWGYISQIMRVYTPADLPVLSDLARGYSVCDRWFASVPTQTNANRAFSLCGTSLGLVNNGFLSPNPVYAKLADDRFRTDTVWNVLERSGFHDWAIFWHSTYPPVISKVPYTRRCFPNLENIESVGEHFHEMPTFFDLAEAGRLPAFSYIEPEWGGDILGAISVMGNEYHPPGDLTPGERLLRQIYVSLTRNQSAWEHTLLIITFDEHGGTYDHVVPPANARAPWGTGTPPKLQCDFPFTRFGLRVPTILVSPLIEERTVFRSDTDVPFDHTSVIATVLEWQGVARDSWRLGERVANAPTFASVLTRDTPRTDNLFAPKPPPAKGTPIHFGEPFVLRHMSGDAVVPAFSGIAYYFPRLGPSGAVELDFRLGWGEVKSGAQVQIRTSEYLVPQVSKELVFAGIRNFLGAWKDQHDCYYYSSNDAWDYGQERWKVTRVDGSPGPIRYGDTVYIASDFTDFRGQRLTRNKEWLSTAKDAKDTWTIEPPAAVQPLGPVIPMNATVHLKHMSGDSVTAADRGRRNWPLLARSSAVHLKIEGPGSNLTNRAIVALRSVEPALGDRHTLGAFWDSHDCYYWNAGYDAKAQGWMIVTVDDTPDREIHYGERVYIINQSYVDGKLISDPRNEGYITTSPTAYDWWTIEKP